MSTGAGSALISISGALFAAAVVWQLVAGVVTWSRRNAHRRAERPSTASASAVHRLVATVITGSGLVTHILGYYSEAFTLIYAGGISMIAATFVAPAGRRPTTLAQLGLITLGLVLLTAGLIL